MNDHDKFVPVCYQSKNQNTPLEINVLVQMLDSSPLVERAHWFVSACQENSIREGSVSVLAFSEASRRG